MPKEKGFTLIELLVVVGIIAILAVVGITIYSSNLKKARDTARKKDITAIAAVLESSYSVSGYLPLSANKFVKEEVPYDPLTSATSRATATPDCGVKICKYCVITINPPPAIASASCDTSTPAIDVGQPPPPAGSSFFSSYIICANLETGGSFCLKNQQ